MAEHFISRDDAERDPLACAAYLAESLTSRDGHAEAVSAVVPLYLDRGEVDLSAELANSVDDPYVRDKLLTLVAERCAARDDLDYALQLADAIEEPGLRSLATENIGIQLAKDGKIDAAREIGGSIAHRDFVLAAVAVRQAADGDDAGAAATIDEIEFPAAAAQALLAMASDGSERGDNAKAASHLQRAIPEAERIEHREERIRSMLDIGGGFVTAGDTAAARQAFELARGYAEELDNVHRDDLLAAVAVGQLRAGEEDAADRTLDSVADKVQIASALLGFSREYWTRGDTAEAMDALEESYAVLKSQKDSEIRDTRNRNALFGHIAAQFAGFEKGERAIGIAQEIDDERGSVAALTQVASILVRQGKPELAVAALEQIQDDSERGVAMVELADTAIASGDREAAGRFVSEANEMAEEIFHLPMRAAAYNGLASRSRRLDDEASAAQAVDNSFEVIGQIRDETSRASAMASLARSLESDGAVLADEQLAHLGKLMLQAGV